MNRSVLFIAEILVIFEVENLKELYYVQVKQIIKL
jgi:hypothetical protein